MGVKAEDFKGVLIAEREFTDKVADKVEAETGVKGFISTDELPKYGITKEDREKIRESFECEENDTVVIVAHNKDRAEKALLIIESEIKNR